MNIEIDYDDEVILAQQDMLTLAKWSNILNSWGWPEDIPNPEPPHQYQYGGRRSRLMDWIENRVGRRAILRDHNKHMTDEEFEDFYRGSYEGNQDAQARHMQRTESRIRAGLRWGERTPNP